MNALNLPSDSVYGEALQGVQAGRYLRQMPPWLRHSQNGSLCT